MSTLGTYNLTLADVAKRKDPDGKVAKIVNEVTLYGQPYVLNTDQTVEQAMKAAGADVVRFQRLAVGEGIEQVVEDYAAEVAKAMQV